MGSEGSAHMSQLLTLTCTQCGNEFRRYASQAVNGRGKYCSTACAAQAKQRPPVMGIKTYRHVSAHDHPLADKDGRVGTHRFALYERIGDGPHGCHWCGVLVNWMPGKRTARGALVVDHLNGERQDNRPENLVPSCHGCNANRTRTNWIRDDELFVLDTNGNRHRAVQRVCEFCGAEFLHLAAATNPTKGRFCSRSCARRHQFRRIAA